MSLSKPVQQAILANLRAAGHPMRAVHTSNALMVERNVSPSLTKPSPWLGKKAYLKTEHFPNHLLASTSVLANTAEVGHLEAYRLDASKDPREAKGQLPGMECNTFGDWFKNGVYNYWELYPLFACAAFYCLITTVITYKTFTKFEIWVDRRQSLPPQDWERCRDNYYKMHATFWDDVDGNGHQAHQRIPLLETLQDEMIEEAKKRGTR